LAAICHHQLYQRRMAKAYDRKVRPREFKEGDLVLRKILPLPSEDRSKWAPNYEGPYVVKKAFSGGALLLTRMDGDDLPRPVNSDSVKKYYVWYVSSNQTQLNEVLARKFSLHIPHQKTHAWSQWLNKLILQTFLQENSFFLNEVLKEWTLFMISMK